MIKHTSTEDSLLSSLAEQFVRSAKRLPDDSTLTVDNINAYLLGRAYLKAAAALDEIVAIKGLADNVRSN